MQRKLILFQRRKVDLAHLQVTFELRDLERTATGPPGTNPKSKIIEKKEAPAQKEAVVAKDKTEKVATEAPGKETTSAAASKE